MAALHVNQLRASSTMKTTVEAIPRQSGRAFLGNGSQRQGGPSQSMTDFRTGENFSHLKLTAEKMMQEQAGVKSDLQILKTKLRKSEDQVRSLESKIQDMHDENATLKVKHKQDMKLWQGLDSKFLSTTTLCDQLAETLKLLDCQLQEAESGKTFLEEKLAERLEFFEHTECRLNDLLVKKQVAEDSVKQCEASNEKLETTIREMEQTLQSDSTKINTLAVEKDDLVQRLTEAIKINEDNEAILRSNRCEIRDLQTEVICKSKEATDLQHLNLTLRQGKGELEFQVKGLQSLLATTRKDNETLQQDLQLFKLKIIDLEKVNTSAGANIKDLLTEKAQLMQQSEKEKIAQGKVVHELKQYLIEQKLDVEGIRHQLQEATKENERLIDIVGKKESKLASLQDEINRMSQECTEKSQLISCMSQNEENLRRGNATMQRKLNTAENAAKSLEIKFNLQLESQQKESSKHLEDVAQSCNQQWKRRQARLMSQLMARISREHRLVQEIADMRRKSEKEIEETIAREMLKGEDALKAFKQASEGDKAKALEALDRRWQSLQEDCERRMSNLREGHEKEKMKIVSIHAEETHKQNEELHRANETIRKLREGQELEKTKIVSIHADELQRKEEELQKVKETIRKLREGHEQEKTKIVAFHTNEIHNPQQELHIEKAPCNGRIAESLRKTAEIRKSNQEEVEKLHQESQTQLQEITEEKSRLHQVMKKMQLTHEELIIKNTEDLKAQINKLEKDQQGQIENVQTSLIRDINEWRSKALGWEIQLKEALQQITTTKSSKEDKYIPILNEDFKMTDTEELVCKDIPTSVVTPVTKDKVPQQQNPRMTGQNTIDLADTTDEDAEEESQKPAPQGKLYIQRSQRPRKRKMDARSPPEDAPKMHGRTSRRKVVLDVHNKKPVKQHQASTESTKASGVCSSAKEKPSMITKDNEPQQQLLIQRQHSVDESRRKTGLTCSQQSDLHAMPGPIHQKGTCHEVLGTPGGSHLEQKMTAPKRRAGRPGKDAAPQEKIQVTKAPPREPSPAISDLFEIDGLVPYYKGDDPYAFH